VVLVLARTKKHKKSTIEVKGRRYGPHLGFSTKSWRGRARYLKDPYTQKIGNQKKYSYRKLDGSGGGEGPCLRKRACNLNKRHVKNRSAITGESIGRGHGREERNNRW